MTKSGDCPYRRLQLIAQTGFSCDGFESPSTRCHIESDSNKYIRAAVFVRVTACHPEQSEGNIRSFPGLQPSGVREIKGLFLDCSPVE